MDIYELRTDRQLIINLKEGNINSFEKIFNLFSPRLFSFVLRYIKSKEDTEEIVQEVFIQLWENRSKINEDLSFKSYLFTITRNKITDYFRKKKIEDLYRDYVKNFTDIISENIYKDLFNKDYDAVLADGIQQLPEKRKVIFIMSKKFGMSRQEIADFFNISENTVKNQLQEAMDFLRQLVKKEVLFITIFFALSF